MQITTTNRGIARTLNRQPQAQAEQPKPETPKEKKPTTGLNLPPNNRYHWDEKVAKHVRTARDFLLPLAFRIKEEGLENIPKDGNFIVGPTHQGMPDAFLASRIMGDKPFGSMSDINQFKGIVGTALSGSGSFPVDRYKEYEGDFPKPAEHAKEILNTGESFIFYPEGRIFNDDHVHPIQPGVGKISVDSSVKYALPVAQDYRKDREFHPVETGVGVLISAAVAGAGIMAGLHGGLAGGIAGALTGMLSGAVVGGGIGAATKMKGEAGDMITAGLKGAALGAIAGGAGAGFVGAAMPGAAGAVVGTTSVLTGLTGLGATYGWTHRMIATTKVGKPIEVEPYRQRAAANPDKEAGKHDQAMALTADFHAEMVKLKDSITGKTSPYKMDAQGRAWGLQSDGRWAQLEQADKKNWTPIQPMVYQDGSK
ncbi:1-acyl-sn-glycerol-3-phosphate acyltransferase [bacterium]|nr:1-acyl-sn-glycerol-3-phosphate acyltransferase [bacterium]